VLLFPLGHTGGVISLDLALRLRAAGVDWNPVAGDRFMVPDKGMDADVFVISEMVVEVQDVPTGRLLRFNGTTEWALDSIEQREVVWLPREDQLRVLLGERFVRLEAVPGGFVVVVTQHGVQQREIDVDADRAYARALLALSG
jgi:hypothetical protein